MTRSTIELRTGGLTLTVGSATDVGLRYPANFDVLHAEALPPSAAQSLPSAAEPALLIVVADGMGASEGSAVAGRTAVEVFTAAVRGINGPIGPEALRAGVAEAQRRVRAEELRLGELTGCTLTALVVEGTAGWIVQIGDSRAYRRRDGLLELLTVDHTMAWLGAINGWFTADSSAAARARYQLTRYVGHPGMPEPDVLSVRVRPGDVYCLCTDGLAEQVPYRRLDEVLGSGRDPGEIAAGLVAEARAAGGNDNATLAIAAVG